MADVVKVEGMEMVAKVDGMAPAKHGYSLRDRMHRGAPGWAETRSSAKSNSTISENENILRIVLCHW
jgi:hypothetical protein